jgi:hypothetical protein
VKNYFIACYVVACIALYVYLGWDEFTGRRNPVHLSEYELRLARWVVHFVLISFFIGGVVLIYAGLAHEIDVSTRNWEWTGRILAFPIFASIWLAVTFLMTYIAATVIEIGRRAFFPDIPIHTHAAEYIAMVLLGLLLAFLAGMGLLRLFPEPVSSAAK